MAKSDHADGRALAGEAVREAIRTGIVEYFAVSTAIEHDEDDATVTVLKLGKE